MKRTKLPKDPDLLVTLPGTLSERTVLNVVTGRRKQLHLLTDKMDMVPRTVQYYTASDLAIGARMEVCGKELMLYDCDNFTREYYRYFKFLNVVAFLHFFSLLLNVVVPRHTEEQSGACYSMSLYSHDTSIIQLATLSRENF